MIYSLIHRTLWAALCALNVGCHPSGASLPGRSDDGGSDNSDAGAGGTSVTDHPALGTTTNTVYHLGLGSQSAVYSVAVDDKNLYWGGVGLTQASKSGVGDRVVLATSATGVFVIRPATDWIYWIDDGALARVQKFGIDIAGETLQRIELAGISVLQRTNPEPERVSFSAGAAETLFIEGETVYVATAGCGAVIRYEPSTFTQTVVKAPVVVTHSTGLTYLLRHGEDIYCGAWNRVFRLHGFDKMEELTSSAVRIAGLAVSSDRLYWLDKLSSASDNSNGQVWTLDDRGRPTKLADILTSIGSTEVYVDTPRNRLVWVDTAIVDFHTGDNSFRIWKHSSFMNGGSAHDADYLYWARSTMSFGTIERIRFDEP
ncbi:MAG: hypothetical protein ABI488_13310 [Polyangiaceae bacterium]